MIPNDYKTFVRLKYGYPLTQRSYNRMPDELVRKLYTDRFQKSTTIPEHIELMRIVIADDISSNNYRKEYWTTSPNVYEIIYKYHENEN